MYKNSNQLEKDKCVSCNPKVIPDSVGRPLTQSENTEILMHYANNGDISSEAMPEEHSRRGSDEVPFSPHPTDARQAHSVSQVSLSGSSTFVCQRR